MCWDATFFFAERLLWNILCLLCFWELSKMKLPKEMKNQKKMSAFPPRMFPQVHVAFRFSSAPRNRASWGTRPSVFPAFRAPQPSFAVLRPSHSMRRSMCPVGDEASLSAAFCWFDLSPIYTPPVKEMRMEGEGLWASRCIKSNAAHFPWGRGGQLPSPDWMIIDTFASSTGDAIRTVASVVDG